VQRGTADNDVGLSSLFYITL